MPINWSRLAIVTAADSGFARLAAGLVRSLRAADAGLGGVGLRIHVLDIGLGPEERRMLAEIATVVAVTPPLPVPGRADQRPFVLSRMVKPFLPSFLPGYAAYLWLDADSWVQEADALERFVLSVTRLDCAAVPEIDPAYRFMFRHDSIERRVIAARLMANCGETAARTLMTLPTVNAGVFIAKAASPLWSTWQKRMAHAFARGGRVDLLCDQAGMNAALYLDEVPFKPLPSELNWLVSGAHPVIDAEGFLATPEVPSRRIGVCHMTHLAMKGPFPVRRVDGDPVRLRFDYDSITEWRVGGGATAGAPA